jgi:cystathionine beta-synthase
MRYLSKVYSDEWMRERGYVDSEVPLTVEDVVNAKHKVAKDRDLIIVGPDQTVFHALHTMQTQDISQLPVFEAQQAVGAIYEDQILNLALQGRDLRKMVIREVMSEPLPTISCESPVERLTYLLSHEEPAVFVKMSSGRLEIITKYDVMGTIAGLMEQKR